MRIGKKQSLKRTFYTESRESASMVSKMESSIPKPSQDSQYKNYNRVLDREKLSAASQSNSRDNLDPSRFVGFGLFVVEIHH